MQKTKSSIYNAIIPIVSTLVSSILALISTRLILSNYGSDFNGVVATVNQIITVILIIEGGYTLAINVALFKPYINKEEDVINSILAAANKIFIKIAYAVLIVGVIATMIYSFFIKSNLDYFTIFSIFLLVIFSTFFNLIFTTKYRIMIHVAQKEYKISFGALILNNVCTLLVILMAYFSINMLIIRFIIMLFAVLNGIYVYILFKKDFKQYNFKHANPDFLKIVGTKDIMIQKVTGAIYASAPILFISTFLSTAMASVYAVYNSIYSIGRMIISSLAIAPINGFGQLIAEKKKEFVYKKFLEHEYIIIIASVLLLSAIVVMINPFISIYTNGIKDINYLNNTIAFMSAIVILFEGVHVPSSNMINLIGDFKVAKKIQLINCILLIVVLLVGSYTSGIFGILAGTIIVNIVMAYMEIHYMHNKYFGESMFNFIKPFFSNVIIATALFFAWQPFINGIQNYMTFFLVGVAVFIINSIVILIFNMILFKEKMQRLLGIFKAVFIKS